MKNYFLVFYCVLLGLPLSAQLTSYSDDFEQEMLHTMAPMDLSQMPGGYFYDRAGRPVLLNGLDGVAQTDSNMMITEFYGTAYRLLESMDVSSAKSPISPNLTPNPDYSLPRGTKSCPTPSPEGVKDPKILACPLRTPLPCAC